MAWPPAPRAGVGYSHGMDEAQQVPQTRQQPSGTRARLTAALKGRAGFIVRWLAERGVKPNHVTLAGLGITLAAVPFIAMGWLWLGGLAFLLGSALDGLDGELARHDDAPPSPFGGVLDSTADRVGEGAAFAALAAHFASFNGWLDGFTDALAGPMTLELGGDLTGASALAAGATVLALVGGNLTSYVRARAEAAGAECPEGLCTRLERVSILGLGLLLHQPVAAIYVLIVLTFATAGQRLWGVRRELG